MLLGIYLKLCAGEQRPHGPSDRQREQTRRGMKLVDRKLRSRDSDPTKKINAKNEIKVNENEHILKCVGEK